MVHLLGYCTNSSNQNIQTNFEASANGFNLALICAEDMVQRQKKHEIRDMKIRDRKQGWKHEIPVWERNRTAIYCNKKEKGRTNSDTREPWKSEQNKDSNNKTLDIVQRTKQGWKDREGYQKHQNWPEIVPENCGSSFRDTRTHIDFNFETQIREQSPKIVL